MASSTYSTSLGEEDRGQLGAMTTVMITCWTMGPREGIPRNRRVWPKAPYQMELMDLFEQGFQLIQEYRLPRESFKLIIKDECSEWILDHRNVSTFLPVICEHQPFPSVCIELVYEADLDSDSSSENEETQAFVLSNSLPAQDGEVTTLTVVDGYPSTVDKFLKVLLQRLSLRVKVQWLEDELAESSNLNGRSASEQDFYLEMSRMRRYENVIRECRNRPAFAWVIQRSNFYDELVHRPDLESRGRLTSRECRTANSDLGPEPEPNSML